MGYEYKTYEIEKKEKRLVLVTDIHHCHESWYGVESADRMDTLIKSLKDEYEFQPYDAILAMGDYSLDFWVCKVQGSYLWDTPVSNTDNFVKTYVPRMPTDIYMIPGNHEQYGQADWERITGRPREYAVVYGDTVFAMLDTFGGDLDPKVHSDGTYTGINAPFLAQILADHPDKRVIICAHEININKESEEARELIVNNPRIVCTFGGHIHKCNTRILPLNWRSLPVFYCGDFSYNKGRQKQPNWGYRTLDLPRASLSTEYVKI